MQIFKFLIITIFLFLLAGCTNRVLFIEKEPISDASLVYIYQLNDVASDEAVSAAQYGVRINNKRVDGHIRSSEYMQFDLKPNTTTFSVVRGVIENKSITIDLKQGQIYYLRVKDGLDNNNFEISQSSNDVGLKEIKSTGLVGSTAVDKDEIITETVDRENSTKSNQTKMDKIKEAHQMKIDGLITEDEYIKLKAEILAQ